MIHHPVILVPKLLLAIVLIAILFALRGMLTASQFLSAALIGAAIFVAASVVIWVVGFRMLSDPESKVGRAAILSRQASARDGFIAAPDQFASLVGQRGMSTSALNPSGTALIGGQRVSVMTHAEFVDAKVSIEVIEAKGARVVVRKVDD